MTTENPPVAYTQFLHRRHRLHPHKKDTEISSNTPQTATSGTLFSRLTVRFCSLQPAGGGSPDGPDAAFAGWDVYSGASVREIALSSVRYDCSSNWASSTGRFFPCWISS